VATPVNLCEVDQRCGMAAAGRCVDCQRWTCHQHLLASDARVFLDFSKEQMEIFTRAASAAGTLCTSCRNRLGANAAHKVPGLPRDPLTRLLALHVIRSEYFIGERERHMDQIGGLMPIIATVIRFIAAHQPSSTIAVTPAGPAIEVEASVSSSADSYRPGPSSGTHLYLAVDGNVWQRPERKSRWSTVPEWVRREDPPQPWVWEIGRVYRRLDYLDVNAWNDLCRQLGGRIEMRNGRLVLIV
jgi:hypothetical protein